jgi:redox-sensing transcriptional repressor
MAIPVPVVERLSMYRRQLNRWLGEGRARIYSHELAALVAGTPAQVRRDLMTIGYSGSPARGYDVAGLVAKISTLLDAPAKQGVILIGVGYLGRAVLKYLNGMHPELPIVAAFDVAPDKVGRMIDGCRCYATNELDTVLKQQAVSAAIIAVPVDAAQDVADRLVAAGVRGLLNFSPVRLHLPPDVYVEDVDISASLEKVVFFARTQTNPTEIET